MRTELRKTKLFNPGPTNVSEEVREALMIGDVCHREKEFHQLMDKVRSNLLKVAHGEETHTAIIFTCSGSGCNEAIISSIEGKVLLINNGKYAERLGEITKRYKIPLVELVFDPLNSIDPKVIEAYLRKDPEITHILMVHHETTTGMLAPLHEIGLLAEKYNKILAVDAISSFGGFKIDLKADNVGFCSVNANKCLESFPGISVVICRKEYLQNLKGKSRSFYFDLYAQWEREENKSESPFTPAVQLLFALDRALDKLLEEGPETRIKRYEQNAARMRKGLNELGFKTVLPYTMQSNILTALYIPEGLDYWVLHDRMKERGYTIYSGQGTLDQGIFRIATLGCLTEKDIEEFLQNLEEVLDEMGVTVKNT
jgi:2-aminoethylphosphonate-pyruvate transaminase